MNRRGLVTYFLMGAFGVSLFLLPGQAHAACSQWEMPAEVQIKQSNSRWPFKIAITPSEGGFVGKAMRVSFTEGSSVYRWGNVEGWVAGAIKGANVSFTIHWENDLTKNVNNATGVYTGTVGPQGRATGSGYNANNPSETATWWLQEPLQCREVATPASPPLNSELPPPGWFSKADIASTPWAFDDLNTVGWAQAGRAASALCSSRGANVGHFTGHQDQIKGIFAVQCAKEDAVLRDAYHGEIIEESGWAFSQVNEVSWARANRAAERLCAKMNKGFAGGHFNGHQLDREYGLVCYRGASRWFDASDAELAATGWGFATPRLDDVHWAQAMRAATGFCQSKGFNGGFMNGHQAPNKYGVVCQKGLGY